MKKITYLVVSLLLMGTTPMLTGCIDNDEPAGIEELRGAKSELLRAKAAVEQAKVATEQANAAYRNAEAEWMKAKAAYEAAQAARVNAETEIEKAEAEQALEEARQKAEQAAKDWELSYKEAEVRYQALLVELATQKSMAIDEALRSYKAAVTEAKASMETKAEALRKAQRTYNEALADWEEDEAKKELYTRGLQKEVTLAERGVEGAELALAEAKEAYEEAQNMELDDVAVKRDELEEKIAQLDKEVFDLKVTMSEKICEYDQTLGAEYRQHQKELLALGKENIQIPAFSLKLNGALPDGLEGSVDAEAAEYSLDAPGAYGNRKKALEKLQEKVLSWVRDGNDDLWTKERIAKKKKDIEELTKTLNDTKQTWKEVVAAYNTNQADVTDPTKITGYAELKKGVDDYNAAATAWNAVNKKIADAESAIEAAKKTYEAKVDELKKAMNAAYAAADATWWETEQKIPEQAESEAKGLQKAVDDAQKALDAADKALTQDPDNNDLKRAKLEAEIALEDAQKAWKSEGELLASLRAESTEARLAAKAKANTDYNTSEAAAKGTRDKVEEEQQAIIKGLKEEGGELEVATKTLNKTVDAICDDGKLFDTFNKKRADTFKEEQSITLSELNIKNLMYAAAYRSVDTAGNPYAEEVDIKELTNLDKAALTRAIQTLSNALYGTAIFKTNEYGDFEARLTEIPEATIKEYAQEALKKDEDEIVAGKNGNIRDNTVSLKDYTDVYGKYGITGQLMSENELVALAEKWITNDDDVMAMVEAVQTALEELTATYEAANDAVEAKEEALKDEWEALMAKIEEAKQPAEEAVAKNEPLEKLLGYYKRWIKEYEENNATNEAGKPWFDKEALDGYVELCKSKIEDAENDLYDANTNLMQAKQNLADFKSGKLTAYKMAAQRLEDAQIAYESAEEAYNAALTELNNKIAELSVSTAE